MNTPVRKVVIVGGGTAGWMSAALLVKMLGHRLDITLVESDDIGTVGVGEATIPPIQVFNKALGIDEDAFLRATGGTIKLGIEFENWGRQGDRYMHAFGPIGRQVGMSAFHHVWLQARGEVDTSDLWDYSFNHHAARADRFTRMPQIPNTPLEGLVYAFHFDAGLYARFLRAGAEGAGVKRVEGMITHATVDGASGNITSVSLKNGASVEGDLFIDCSGFRALLIGEALGVGYEDWTHWLPCDRAVAVPAENGPRMRPYTQSIAHKAGWQWRIPLQHRAGNGNVFCSDFISDDEATGVLMANLEGKPLADPRVIKFKTGRRNSFWEKNCVAIGLSSGFMEPLESTSIHLIQTGIVRLVQMFPSIGEEPSLRAEYNRQLAFEYERIRDFIILHYHANSRTDSDFWRACANMAVPESLKARMDLFAESGLIFRDGAELFAEVAWLQVMWGQGIRPRSHSPLASNLTGERLAGYMRDLRTIMESHAAKLPAHTDFIRTHCAAGQ
jgi:tryptophan halogenase